MNIQMKKEQWIEFLWATTGCFLFAFGVNVIITPLGLYNGGFMGMAQLIRTVLFRLFDFSFLRQKLYSYITHQYLLQYHYQEHLVQLQF